ncbi:MAG: tetratricopeptide repeat protein [Polyangia bacterium]
MYSARAVASVLGMSVARLRSYLRAGVVTPTRTEKGEMRFSFDDLVLLRKAEGLVEQRIPARRVRDAIKKIRDRLPAGASLHQVALSGEGQRVIADDGHRRWHPDSGQVVFDFKGSSPDGGGATVTSLANARAGTAPAAGQESPLTARDLYKRGCMLESTSAEEACDAYRAALELEPEFADAHVNLGRLLHEVGDVYAALVHYRAALSLRPGDTTAAFNVGVALEDLGATIDAIAAYRRALECEPRNPDAHYNLARLLEQDGKPDLAVRHLLLYRQLTKKR